MKYFVYNGVENEFTYHNTESEALGKLRLVLEESHDGQEWYDGAENSFMGVITRKLVEVPTRNGIDLRIEEIK